MNCLLSPFALWCKNCASLPRPSGPAKAGRYTSGFIPNEGFITERAELTEPNNSLLSLFALWCFPFRVLPCEPPVRLQPERTTLAVRLKPDATHRVSYRTMLLTTEITDLTEPSEFSVVSVRSVVLSVSCPSVRTAGSAAAGENHTSRGPAKAGRYTYAVRTPRWRSTSTNTAATITQPITTICQ